MTKEVSFCSNLFENKIVKPHFINDRCFGEDLAAWLTSKLKISGFAFNEPYQEDWGWQIEVQSGRELFFISIGIMDESIGEENAEWHIAIEHNRSWFSFKKPDTNLQAQLCNEIDKVLSGEEKITRIEWRK